MNKQPAWSLFLDNGAGKFMGKIDSIYEIDIYLFQKLSLLREFSVRHDYIIS